MPLLLKPLAVQFKVSTPSRPHCDALGTPFVFQLKNHETHCLFPAPFQPHVSSDPWPARSLSPDDWSAVIPTKHYVSAIGMFVQPAGGQWFEGDLSIQGGGDQATRTSSSANGTRTLGAYLNIADAYFFDWGDDPVIDILVQFYGDASILAADGTPRDFLFLTGTLPGGPNGNLNEVAGGSLPVEANNGKWNWALFRIENGTRPDGGRYVDQPADIAQGNIGAGSQWRHDPLPERRRIDRMCGRLWGRRRFWRT